MQAFPAESSSCGLGGIPWGCFLAGLTILAWAGLHAHAQSADPRVIYMVIQAEPNTTEKTVKGKFARAIDNTAGKGCDVRDVLVEPINSQTFTLLRGILQRGLNAVKEEQAAREGQLIQPVVGVDSAWSIDLGDPFDLIETVTVTWDGKDGKSRAEKVTVQGPNPTGYSLKLHTPGRYVLSLPKGDSPSSVEVDIIHDDGAGEPQQKTLSQIWPSAGRAYLVTLSDVIGDETLLFAALKDPNVVPNPIREIQDATKASLMVASFVEVLGNRLRIQGGQITFSFPKPQGVSPKRLWLRFPLTAEELAGEKNALEAVIAAEGAEQLPEKIRANVGADSLAPGRGAGWVELPLTADGFTGVFDLDVDAWVRTLQESPATVGDNALLIYEFEDADSKYREPIKMTEGYIVTAKIGEWLPALRAVGR